MSLSMDKYEYINEDTIDDELKCIICTQPLQSPVSLDCQHTFCQFCIETWIKQNASCPICRRQFGTKYVLTKMTNSDICNQLDCLLVRCLRCRKADIKRIKYKKHSQRCFRSRMTTVSNICQNRWRSMTSMTWAKYNRQAIAPVTRVAEIMDINHEERGGLYRELQNVHLQTDEQQFSGFRTLGFPGTASSRWPRFQSDEQRIQNRTVELISKRKRQAVFYFCILIVAVMFLIIFEGAIISFLQVLGKASLIFLPLWIWIKLRQTSTR